MKIHAIIAHTQVIENYGAEDMPYWKPKFGGSYWIGNIECPDDVQPDVMARSVPVDHIETRNSTMLIEYVKHIETTTVDDAKRRAAIDTNTDDPEIYFSRVEVPRTVLTYQMPDRGQS